MSLPPSRPYPWMEWPDDDPVPAPLDWCELCEREKDRRLCPACGDEVDADQ